ncbi:MAG: YtxH domain-containing protein [Bacteroidia bacterium]|nr:YtxH domain-containing protein [Bacteroidia bacterium]
MEKKTTLILSFIAGAAVGAAVGYLLSSGKGEELLSDLKEAAGKVKDEFDKQTDKGKEFINDLNNMAHDNT